MVDEDGSPKYADYEDYIINHERQPGIGALAGFRGNGEKSGRGEPNPGQIEAYKANGAFWHKDIPGSRYYKMANIWHTKNLPLKWVSMTQLSHTLFRFIVRRCRNSLSCGRAWKHQPPEHLRPRIKTCFTPLPTWYAPFEGEAVSDEEYPTYTPSLSGQWQCTTRGAHKIPG